jgi:hypothetical protein
LDAATIITSVITQSGTDASRQTILSVLNERYADQVAQSQWALRSVAIANTVAGQSVYPLPALPEIVEVLGLQVGGGRPWDRVGLQDMWMLESGTSSIFTALSGVFAPSYDVNGQAAITLYPTPIVAGLPIVALSAVLPTALTDDSSSLPVTPSDLHGSLIDGVTSMILRRVDEREDLAAPYEQIFATATEEMRKRKNSLLRGRGPVQIQVAGYHWDNSA